MGRKHRREVVVIVSQSHSGVDALNLPYYRN